MKILGLIGFGDNNRHRGGVGATASARRRM
jgi:hypothetical protein